MLIRARVALPVISGALWLCVAAGAQGLAEREALRLCLIGSPYTREFRATTEVVEAQSRAWHVWPNPQAGFEHEGAGLTQVTRIQQSFPINGRFRLLERAGNAAIQAATAEGEFTIWNACSDMRSAFYHVVLSQQREAALTDGLSRLQEVVRILGEREEHGEGSLFDLRRAEQELSDLRAEMASFRAFSAQARSRLISALDGSLDPISTRAQGTLEMDTEMPSLAEVLRLASEQRQDYQAEKRRQERYGWEEQAAHRIRIPDPVVFAGIKRAEEPDGIRYGPHVGFSLSIPLFDRGQNRVAELEAEARRSSYRQELLDQQIRAEVSGAYEELRLRRQAAEDYRTQVEEQGAQLEQIAILAYQEGELGILELLDAHRIRRQSILRLLELSAAAKQAEINLERAVGKPVLNPEVMP